MSFSERFQKQLQSVVGDWLFGAKVLIQSTFPQLVLRPRRPADKVGLQLQDLNGNTVTISMDGIDGIEVGSDLGTLPTNIADGFLKRDSTNTAWEEVPYGTTANTVCEGNDSRLGSGLTFPLDIPGCFIWCAADQLSGYSDGDVVESWLNLAGGPALNSTIGTTRPKYKTNIINSLPVIRFDGTGWYALSSIDLVMAREMSFFLVMKITSLANAYTGMVTGDSGGFGYYIKSNGKTAFYDTGTSYDGTGSATFLTSSFYVVSFILGPVGVTTRVALAGDATSSNNAFQSTSGGFKAALANETPTGTARAFTGDIAEFIAIRRAVSSTELSTIENTLKDKYGL